jgi:hypothetical protein
VPFLLMITKMPADPTGMGGGNSCLFCRAGWRRLLHSRINI